LENSSFFQALILSSDYLSESSIQVSYVLGGVARNVAECMSKLGANPFMISALGLDMAGDFVTFLHLTLQSIVFQPLQEPC
jgi:sugar/nucleoside kinase (ribokinase family)